MQIYLARTQGFCAGVARAIEIVEQSLVKYGAPLYVYHEIVHNTAVVNGFKAKGVIFTNDISLLPEGSLIILSAHGVPPSLIHRAQSRRLRMVDATCPLVTKVHNEAILYSRQAIDIVLIGHQGHEEVVGTAGYVAPELLHIVQNTSDVERLPMPPHKKVAFITQTTLSVDETREIILKLRARYPNLIGPAKDDICYATQNRQDAVKELAHICEVIVICGSQNSSNSNRLREKGEQLGVPSYIIDNAEELDLATIKGKNKIGLSSGASVPRHLVDEIVKKIRQHFPPVEVITFANPETNIVFPLPEI